VGVRNAALIVRPERLGAYLLALADVLGPAGLPRASSRAIFGEGGLHMRIDFDVFVRRGIATSGVRRAARTGLSSVGRFVSVSNGDWRSRSGVSQPDVRRLRCAAVRGAKVSGSGAGDDPRP